MTREEAIKVLRKLPVGLMDLDNEQKWDLTEALDLALTALRGPTREMVERMQGKWKHYLPPLGAGNVQCRCTSCGRTPDVETPFCAWCGSPMTDEAVDMTMERLEAMKDGKGD